MSLFGLEVLFGLYSGTRLTDRYLNRRNGPKFVVTSQSNATQMRKAENADTPLSSITNTIAAPLAVLSHFVPSTLPLAVFSISHSALPFVRETERSLLNGKLQNELLNTLVLSICFLTNQYLTAAFLTLIYNIGTRLANKIQSEASASVASAFSNQPRTVWLLKDGCEVEVLLESIHAGDILSIGTGDVIAVDGIVTDGNALIDQHSITGEFVPVEKGVTDSVLAGTVIISGKLEIKVESSGDDTSVSKLSRILNRTTEYKTNLQVTGEIWANNVAPPLLALGLLSYPLLGLPATATLLFSSPGNGVRLFGSVQTLNHINAASKHGILVKDGRVLEEARRVDTVIFDKTGTLTEEQPEVGKIVVTNDSSYSIDDVLLYAASVERKLSHPIAKAILNKAAEKRIVLRNVQEDSYRIGYGIEAVVDMKRVNVGSLRYMRSQKMQGLDEIQLQTEGLETNGGSLIFVAIDNKLQGIIEILPKERSEVREVIEHLKRNGVSEIAIISGDHRQPTEQFALSLGLDSYYYDVLPQDKASIIEEYQRRGRVVCFVGDGVNDSVAMKQANVSVSLTGATTVAIDLAQVVLLNGHLRQLCDLFNIANQLDKKLKQSLGILVGYSTVNSLGAVLLRMHPIYSMGFASVAIVAGTIHATRPVKIPDV